MPHLAERNECLKRRQRRQREALAPVDGQARARDLHPGLRTGQQRQLRRCHLRQQHLRPPGDASQETLTAAGTLGGGLLQRGHNHNLYPGLWLGRQRQLKRRHLRSTTCTLPALPVSRKRTQRVNPGLGAARRAPPEG